MKKFYLLTVCSLLLSVFASAQTANADSLSRLKKEQDILKLKERLSEYRSDSLSLETELREKMKELQELKTESQSLADKNYQYALSLQRDAHSKTATKRADKAASAARKAAKKVRKAESSVNKTEKKLRKLKKNIDKEEKRLQKLTVEKK